MGQEVFLFTIKFDNEVLITEFDNFLKEQNFKFMKKEKSIETDFYYYEKNTISGITEISIIIKKDIILEMYCRFSLLNPISVIDQTFEFFYSLLHNYKVTIRATEENIIFEKDSKSNLKKVITEKKIFFNQHRFDANLPIRGGNETFEYIRLHKNEE